MPENREQSLKEHSRIAISELTKEEQQLLSGIIKAEREKLHMKLPKYIKDDLWKVICEVIK